MHRCPKRVLGPRQRASRRASSPRVPMRVSLSWRPLAARWRRMLRRQLVTRRAVARQRHHWRRWALRRLAETRRQTVRAAAGACPSWESPTGWLKTTDYFEGARLRWASLTGWTRKVLQACAGHGCLWPLRRPFSLQRRHAALCGLQEVTEAGQMRSGTSGPLSSVAWPDSLALRHVYKPEESRLQGIAQPLGPPACHTSPAHLKAALPLSLVRLRCMSRAWAAEQSRLQTLDMRRCLHEDYVARGDLGSIAASRRIAHRN
jgi:hypothetical protein